MKDNTPYSDWGNSSSPKNEDDDTPIQSESTPYMAPDGREHIIEIDAEAPENTKSPQSQ